MSLVLLKVLLILFFGEIYDMYNVYSLYFVILHLTLDTNNISTLDIASHLGLCLRGHAGLLNVARLRLILNVSLKNVTNKQ